MVIWAYALIIAFSAWLLSFAGTYGMRELMKNVASLRIPNERDNHSMPTPRGGGVAIMVAVTGFLVVTGVDASVVLAAILLTIISLSDDLVGLSVTTRIIAHACAALMLALSLDGSIAHNVIPLWMERILIVLVLVWFMNISNFMDGIDEISCVHTASVMIGLIGCGFLLPELPRGTTIDAMIVLSAIAGFWYFNRHPASIFMGDAGSIPLGALTGWLLLSLAAQGYWVPAVILPAYFIVDSGITLIKRMKEGETLWHAHSQHAYQLAVRKHYSHRYVTAHIAGLNLLLIALALATLKAPYFALYYLIAAYGLTCALYAYFLALPVKESDIAASTVDNGIIEGVAREVHSQPLAQITG